MELLEDIIKTKFLLVLLDESRYIDKLAEMFKSMEKDNRICYLCLSKTYDDIVKDLRKKGINTKKFFFIDVLGSHYGKRKSTNECLFLQSPTELADIETAIKRAVKEKKCSVILFDTISAMLIYQETSSIVKFTHNLITSKEQENAKKIFIVLKDDILKEDNEMLTKDLTMFADKTINLIG